MLSVFKLWHVIHDTLALWAKNWVNEMTSAFVVLLELAFYYLEICGPCRKLQMVLILWRWRRRVLSEDIVFVFVSGRLNKRRTNNFLTLGYKIIILRIINSNKFNNFASLSLESTNQNLYNYKNLIVYDILKEGYLQIGTSYFDINKMLMT